MRAPFLIRVTGFSALVFSLGLQVAFAEGGGEFLPSGVSTEAIQLPQVAGSIQGFDREAASVGNTGALTYSVPIQVPKGRNGLQPNLSLAYNSTAGEGPYGIGWKIDYPLIERSTLRGVPQYTNSDLMNSSQDGELVSLGNGAYRPLIDNSQSWYSYQSGTDSWTRLEGNGLVDTFGGRPDAKVLNAAGTFQWLISTAKDPFGNRIEYFYQQDRGQTYLSEVRYVFSDSSLTTNLYDVQFTYGPRTDVLTNYKSTYPVTTALICTDIRVVSHELIRHYKFSYDLTPNGKLSRLTSIDLYGTDDTTKFPTLRFSYSEETSPAGQTALPIHFQITGSQPFPQSFSDSNVTYADLNSDSIPDIIQTSEKGAQVWLGNGDGSYQAAYTISNLLGTLGGKNARLMDVDGDRQVDFVGSGQYPKYWPGDGNGGFKTPVNITNFPRYSVGSPQVRTFDVNGDGRMDLIAQEPDALWVFFNQGNGSWGQALRVPNDASHVYPIFQFSSPKTFFVDMNGDGLTDIAYVDTNRVYYYPSLGNGQWAPVVPMDFAGVDYQNSCTSPANCPNPPPILQAAQHTKSVFLMDINGDGLADLVVVFPNEILYAYNQGDGTFGLTQTLQGIQNGAMDQHNLAITTADVNGNGSSDIIWSNDSGDFRYFDFTAAGKPNLLVQIKNGLGKTTAISYLPHTKMGSSSYVTDGGKIPFVAHVVSDIQVSSWGDLASETRYKYFGPYYNGPKNEFRGFQVIEKTLLGDDSVPDKLTRQIFEVGQNTAQDQERGLLLSQEERDAVTSRKGKVYARSEGPILRSETHQYTTFATATAPSGESPALPLETEHTLTEGDEIGTTPRTYSISTAYTLSQGAIQSSVASTYSDQGALYRSTADTYALGIQMGNGVVPSLWNVTHLAQRDLRDSSGSTIKSSRLYYDQSSTLGQVTLGKVTRIDRLSSGNYVTKNTYTWTSDGNLATFADAALHTTQITYDRADRLFATQVVNPKSQTELANYDFDLGVMTQSRDVNSNWKGYAYDPFLRVTQVSGPVTDPTQTDSAHIAEQFIYTFGDDTSVPSTIESHRYSQIGGTTSVDSEAYFDGLGRSLGTILSGPPSKFVNTGSVQFNTHGKVKKKFLPFFTNGLNDFSTNYSRPFVGTTFDVLDRPLQVSNPESTQAQPSVEIFQYKVGERDFTDELGRPTKKSFDFLDRLTQYIDALQNSTTFAYTISDQPGQITDAKGEITSFTYDSLDRRTCKLDPNIGQTTYQYNDLDLLVQKSDYGFEAAVTSCAKSNSNAPRISTFQYNDPLNRITQETFSDTTPPLGFSYDDPTFGINGIGELTGTTFGSGSKTLKYDQMGRTVETDYTVSGGNYVLKEQRDLQGRITEVDYPSVKGSVLRVGYTFDPAGNISQIFNLDTNQVYASNITYNELNQIHTIQFGNGLKTRYNFDVGQGSYRLTDILTYSGASVSDSTPISTACSATRSIQCLGYQYDLTSNITEVDDYKVSTNLKQFAYDNLNQLTHATGPWGTQEFLYDSIGNIQTMTAALSSRTGFSWLDSALSRAKAAIPGMRSVTSYTYSSSRPQVLTSVGTTAYNFDPFGNLSQIGSVGTFSFDSQNHLSQFLGSQTATYSYDEQGTRVAKVSSAGNVIFIGKYFDTGSGDTRYVFSGSKRIAKIDSKDAVSYFHQDQLNSPSLVTDSTGNVIQEREYSPYGGLVTHTGGLGQFPYGFTDKYLDGESGLSYFGARYFIPGVGRWASADPTWSDEAGSALVRSLDGDGVLRGKFMFNGRGADALVDVSDDKSSGFGRRNGTSEVENYQLAYVYGKNNPIKFTDGDGRRIDWGGFVFSNPVLVQNFEKLNDNIVAQHVNSGMQNPDNFVLKVTGGDRYVDGTGNFVSATDGSTINPQDTNKNSPHLVQNGARAIDFAGVGVSQSEIKAAREDTAFKGGEFIGSEHYVDHPHEHMALPNTPENRADSTLNPSPGTAPRQEAPEGKTYGPAY